MACDERFLLVFLKGYVVRMYGILCRLIILLAVRCLRFVTTPALAAEPMRMESMQGLLRFLLAVPEHARVGITEVAVAVLLQGGLVDSASCLLGNVGSTSPRGSSSDTAEIFYRRSLDILPDNPVTGA